MFIFILLVFLAIDALLTLTNVSLSIIQLVTILIIQLLLAFIFSFALLYRQRDLTKDNRLRKVETISLISIFLIIYIGAIYYLYTPIYAYFQNEVMTYGCIIGGYLIIVLPISYILTIAIVDKLNHNKRDII